MPKKKMLVHWEDGAELSQSRKKPGDYSPLTRDGDNNLGHVTLSDVDEDEGEDDWQTDPEPDPEPLWYINANGEFVPSARGEEMLAGVLGIILAVERAAPHIKRWWNDRAVPFLKESRRRLSKDHRTRDQVSVAEYFMLPQPAQTESSQEVVAALDEYVAVAEYFMLPESASTESSQEVVAALDEYRASMSSAEARERFVAALVARLFSEEQLRVLRNVRIEDEGPAWELASAMEALTPRQLGESITLMLEANPSWPEEETLAELERILVRSSQGDDEYVPVGRGRIIRELRLPGTGE